MTRSEKKSPRKKKHRIFRQNKLRTKLRPANGALFFLPNKPEEI